MLELMEYVENAKGIFENVIIGEDRISLNLKFYDETI